MGAVYEVIDERSDRRRALKVLLPNLFGDEDIRSRFAREAKVTGSVESEHLVEIFDAGVDDQSNAPYLVMELLRGEDLESVLRGSGPLPPADVVTVLSQTAVALGKTHAMGIIHRDLKPENLFLTRRDDGSPRLKILDFGLAKVMATVPAAAGSTRVLGTPQYMSPEQMSGNLDVGPSADLYALGHIAFTLLVGSFYWSPELKELGLVPFLMRAAQGAVEPATVRAARFGRTLPAAFDAWFARATAVQPASRFPSPEVMIGELAMVLGLSAPVPQLGSGPVSRLSLSGGGPAMPSPVGLAPVSGAQGSVGFAHATSTGPGPLRPRWPLIVAAFVTTLVVGGGGLAIFVARARTLDAARSAAPQTPAGEVPRAEPPPEVAPPERERPVVSATPTEEVPVEASAAPSASSSGAAPPAPLPGPRPVGGPRPVTTGKPRGEGLL